MVVTPAAKREHWTIKAVSVVEKPTAAAIMSATAVTGEHRGDMLKAKRQPNADRCFII